MKDILKIAQQVFKIESIAIQQLEQRLDATFEKAAQIIAQCKGRAVICGMGKSGWIGKKIVATWASVGVPSLFLHPSEAIHGDLGLLMQGDCFISISNSGETDEILQLLPHIKRLNLPHICLVGNTSSTLAQWADVVLDIGVEMEASSIASVPMASTTATLAMGDALAAALMALNNFKQEDFALNHPGGTIGKKLLTKVSDKMQTESLPVAQLHDSVQEIIPLLSQGQVGTVAICNTNRDLLGIITDGDIRRALQQVPNHAFFELQAKAIMTPVPKVIAPNHSVMEAEQLMNQYKITTLLVVEDQKLVGVLAKHHIN